MEAKGLQKKDEINFAIQEIIIPIDGQRREIVKQKSIFFMNKIKKNKEQIL